MKKFICLHGHFYQPPRENPWTGEVDAEASAAPFRDWNERISKECYQANAHAAIPDPKGGAAEHVNNFEAMSFDIGPTLLSWMKTKDPATYQAILDADKKSLLERNGHGNAIAQCYNHLIMPLASRRDKTTQVIWGIKDFEFHYKRKPEGMWLPETAVDHETLSILAEQDIRYTILSPHQASRVRHIGFGSRWKAIHHESIDTKQAYRIILEHGRQLHLFFYDAPLSRAVAFNGLLNNGDTFTHQLLGAFSGRHDRPQLVSTATDGETFGHHHHFGEMALAYAVKKIEKEKLARVTNYGEFLSRQGSFWEVDIHDGTSWSCAHGIERWRSDCGCRIHHEEGWNQAWRSPLRESFDFLKRIVDSIFDSQGGALLKDPWEARNDFVELMLEDGPERREAFLRKHSKKHDARDEAKIWDLLEAEKLSLFMFTSCGWFFDELSGIEPLIVMRFAARVMERIRPYAPQGFEGTFFSILRGARSNLPDQGNGETIFKRNFHGF